MDKNELNENFSPAGPDNDTPKRKIPPILKYAAIVLSTAVVSVGITLLIAQNFYVPKDEYNAVVQQMNSIQKDVAGIEDSEATSSESSANKASVNNTEGSDAKLKVSSVEASTYSRVDESEYQYYAPEPGNVFVIFFIELENTSSNSCFFSLSDFEVYQDNVNTKFTRLGYGTAVEGYDPLIEFDFDEVEVKPGRKQSGYLAVEIPEDWETLEFIYADDDIHTFTK